MPHFSPPLRKPSSIEPREASELIFRRDPPRDVKFPKDLLAPRRDEPTPIAEPREGREVRLPAIDDTDGIDGSEAPSEPVNDGTDVTDGKEAMSDSDPLTEISIIALFGCVLP